jgi:hypothetical protein
MISSELLDIVIGVVFAWFVLSLVVSVLGEAFAWAAKTRSKLLWRSVGQLFDQGLQAADARLRSLLVKSPLGLDDVRPGDVATRQPWWSRWWSALRSTLSGRWRRRREARGNPVATDPPQVGQPVRELYTKIARRVPEPAAGRARTRISRIPTDVFGDAFQALAAETVTRASLTASFAKNSSLPAALGELADGPLDRATLLAKLGDNEALQAEFAATWERAARIVTIEDIEALLGGNQPLLARVRAVVDAGAASEVAINARREVERWFDGTMESLSTFYRRQKRKLLALIAVPVVLFANSSAFGLYRRLHDDENVSKAAATAAAGWAVAPLEETDLGAVDLDAVCTRIAEERHDSSSRATSESEPVDTPATTEATETTETTEPDVFGEVQRRLDCASQLFSSTDLLTPFGPQALLDEIRAADDGDGLWGDVWAWKVDGLGRIVTWVALLFGASFWYDSLRRLVGLRGKLAGASKGGG